MGRLVVAIHPDGSVETLLKDRVFDTRIFGDRCIERLSEVIPTSDGQRFQVRWLTGPRAGRLETGMFPTYEDAVDYEVNTVNDLRRRGYSFKGEPQCGTT